MTFLLRRHNLKWLFPVSYATLKAAAEVLVTQDDEEVTPEEVARNVDRYMDAFLARRKWIVQVALVGLYAYPLLFFKAPFPRQPREERLRFVQERFQRDVALRRVLLPRNLVQGMIRITLQMAYLGYYSDKRTFKRTGYVPFSERPEFAEATKSIPRDRPKVTCVPHDDVGETLDADVVVIGSGAGGGLLAYRVATDEAHPRRVLVLERGSHVDPSTFTEDEIDMISRLYQDGALQLSRDFSFQMLQGMCVGGSTVVNNAVCFDLRPETLAHWNGPEHEAGLDAAALARSFTDVRKLMGVQRQTGTPLNGGAQKFVDGMNELGLDRPPNDGNIVEANISGCPGSGYCNIGCAFGSKLSMLDHLLPKGQAHAGADGLRVLADCEAELIQTDGTRATEILCRLEPGGRRVRVRANTIVVSGGAMNSSWLLMKSDIARDRAGRHLCFNMGSPITAAFDEPLRSYEGLQISHYFAPPESAGYVMETWYNPVATQALTMPGWFEDHARNMREYANMTGAGILVGTQRNGTLRKAVTGGWDVDYVPAKEDLKRLVGAMKLLSRIYLAAGAKRVMPATFTYHEFTRESQLDALDGYVRDHSDLQVGTGHPQGGNAMSANPARGVVGPDFRVHGLENVFVCDASVFPSSTTVNPQLTVMALANLAAPHVIAAG